MHKYIILLTLFACLQVSAQDVQFFQGTWEEANAKARAENKMLLVDAFTYWCGPCKMMDKQMFHNNPEVAELINTHFIAYKTECEHDAGLVFARKYKVNAYPTLLFFNSRGELLDKQLGYNDDQQAFLAGIQKMIDMDQNDTYAMDPTRMVMPWPDFYVKFFKDANDSSWKRDRTVDANVWLDTQEDLFSETVWAVMYMYNLNEKYNAHFLNNYTEYQKRYKFEATDKVTNLLYADMQRAVKENKPELMEQAEATMRKYFPDQPEQVFYLRYSYYEMQGKWNDLALLFENYLKTGGESSLGLVNNIAWSIYEKCSDEAILSMALTWFDPYLTGISDYNSMDTYAALLFKVKRYDDAEKWALSAIEQGKKDAMNVQGTEDLLQQIRAAK